MDTITTARLSGGIPAAPAEAPTEVHHPGVIRVTHGSARPEAIPQVAHESARVHGGALRMNGTASDPESIGFARHSVSFDGTTGGSVVATLQRVGAHATVELVPGVPGSRTQVAAALRAGVIREVQPGIYEDAQARLQAPQGAPEQGGHEPQQVPGAEVFDPADDAAWAEAIEPLPQHAYDSAAASVALAVVTGKTLEEAARTLAGNAGMDPADAAEYVQAGYALHEKAVAKAVQPLGIEGERKDAFYAWSREHPARLQEAVQKLVHMRDPSGFVELARSFKRANPGDLSAFHAAGLETHVGTDGEVLLKRPGGEWVPAAAVLSR